MIEKLLLFSWQVARWKPLISKTFTYKKTAAAGEKEKEIPGIKLYDHTDGEMFIVSDFGLFLAYGSDLTYLFTLNLT